MEFLYRLHNKLHWSFISEHGLIASSDIKFYSVSVCTKFLIECSTSSSEQIITITAQFKGD